MLKKKEREKKSGKLNITINSSINLIFQSILSQTAADDLAILWSEDKREERVEDRIQDDHIQRSAGVVRVHEELRVRTNVYQGQERAEAQEAEVEGLGAMEVF